MAVSTAASGAVSLEAPKRLINPHASRAGTRCLLAISPRESVPRRRNLGEGFDIGCAVFVLRALGIELPEIRRDLVRVRTERRYDGAADGRLVLADLLPP